MVAMNRLYGMAMNRLYGMAMLMATSGEGGENAGDPIGKFFSIILDMITPLQTQVNVICAIVIIGCGLLFMLPLGKEVKKKAGGYIVFLIIGAILLMGATNYGAYVSSKVAF